MRTTYRDDLAAARIQRDELLARRRGELGDALASAGVVYVDRVARSTAGLAAIGGAILVASLTALNAVTGLLGEPSFVRYPPYRGASGVLTLTLLLAWIGVVAAYFAGRSSARRALARFASRDGAAGDDVHADLARLRAGVPASRIGEMAAAREGASVTRPLAGFVLLAPLTLHLAIFAFVELMSVSGLDSLADFDFWLGGSLLAVGHCHVLAALLMRRLGRRMSEAPTEALLCGEPPSLGVLGWTLVASLVPGMIVMFGGSSAWTVVMGLIALFVAVTGVAVVPTSAAWMRRRLIAERQALE